ncbi:hypothetical protein SCHPADRAFT_997336 [Schizopora paradoxa]|uniref:Uncharacterized protein n=1 Tax=Schizopora paradoxa TaxID=27342 RepID=A0A0H2RPE7_9AGAM|nr:hypothetical protein SCHPADRAFT_997336 [Schizopora paradoxa]
MPPSKPSFLTNQANHVTGFMGNLTVFMTKNVNVQNDFVSNALTNQPSLDPGLNKNLKLAVNSVSPRVVSVRKSFETVETAISDLKHSKNTSLVLEWRDIVKDYKRVLTSSGGLALHGAGQIQDFLDTIMPYLLEENDDIAGKQGELENYRKVLKEGGKEARNFSDSLDEISQRVGDFKEKWADHTDEVVTHIRQTIEQLEKDLESLSHSMQEVRKGVASIKSSAHADLGNEPSKAMVKHHKSEVKREIKEAERESKRQIKSEQTVAKNADSINSKTDGLMVVWNLINDDINVIETQLKTCVAGRSPVLFRQRVSKLQGQYQGLEDSLRKYATALSLEPTDNSGRSSLFRVFTRLIPGSK